MANYGRCIRCWDATWLSEFDQPNHFLASTLQTEVAKGRLDTEASPNVILVMASWPHRHWSASCIENCPTTRPVW